MNTQTNEAAAPAAQKRARRSPEEAQKARLEREAKLAEKQAKRAERLKKEAEAAEKRLKEIEERKTAIASNKPLPKEKKEVPVIGETRASKMTTELKKMLKDFGDKHGVNFEDLTPRLTQQGQALSLRLVAHVASQTVKAGVKLSERVVKAVGATKEATRFIEKAKLTGIRPALLGKNIQLAGDENTYKVMGMKGAANDIVLQRQVEGKPAEGDDATKTVSADEFKTKMVMA